MNSAPASPARLRIGGALSAFAEAVPDEPNRVIRGYAVITKGEALGHAMWIDDETLFQVAELGNAALKGVKVRFTHPGLCADGLGTFLGRAKEFRVEGDIVRADLHFAPASVTSKSPNHTTDPVDYILDLAAHDPSAFATSIVFCHDLGAEDRFVAEHTDEDGKFYSPDPDNTNNFFHARLAELRASDLVDEPAANPGGFFSDTEEMAAKAESAMLYAFGLNDNPPAPGTFGTLENERVRDYFKGFLARHHFCRKEFTMAENANANLAAAGVEIVPAKPQLSAKDFAAEMAEAFPEDSQFALSCITEGLSVEQAKAKHRDALLAVIAEKDAELAALAQAKASLEAEAADLRKQLASGEPAAADHVPEPKALSSEQQVALAKQMAADEGISFENAYRKLLAQ